MEIDMEIKRKTKDELTRKKKPYASWYREDEVYLDQSGKVPLLRFQSCEQEIWMKLAFSTRLGGCSEGYLSTLNLGWDRGDSRETVCENYRRVCETLQADYRRLVLSDQVHATKVLSVDERYCGGEKIEKKMKGIDGMYTDIPGLILATSYADCVPLFFFDSRQKRIASSHSGWKGTVSKMGQTTVEAMTKEGSRLEDIEVVIGPSICQDCYEVSREVIEQFQQAYPEHTWQDIFCYGRVTEDGEQKYQLDLWAANWHQLIHTGILPEHIHVSGVCTCCNESLLYSHRASHGKRGNLNGFIYICD